MRWRKMHRRRRAHVREAMRGGLVGRAEWTAAALRPKLLAQC